MRDGEEKAVVKRIFEAHAWRRERRSMVSNGVLGERDRGRKDNGRDD